MVRVSCMNEHGSKKRSIEDFNKGQATPEPLLALLWNLVLEYRRMVGQTTATTKSGRKAS